MARYERRDHFHQRARREGYRSRAAYKLQELQRAHRLIGRGQRVVDLGCWPGGWMQIAAEVVGSRGRVVGVDLAATDPFDDEHIVALQADLEDPAVWDRVVEILGGPADVLLSDAAPKLTGQRDVDNAATGRLLEGVEAALPRLLAEGGSLLVKLIEGPDAAAYERRIAAHFERSKRVRTAATRKGSSERFLLARGYRVD